MPKQKNKDIIDTTDSVLTTKSSIFNPENNSKEIVTKPILETELVAKKSISEKWQTHRFWIVKGSFYLLRSIWMIVMVIGGFIAWLISLLFI